MRPVLLAVLLVLTMAAARADWSGLDNLNLPVPLPRALERGRVVAFSVAQNEKFGVSGMGQWVPGYDFNDVYGLYLSLGLGPIHLGDRFEVISDYTLLFSYRPVENWSFELGAGAQTWIEQSVTSVETTVNVVYHATPKLLGFVEGVVGGFTGLFHPYGFASEARVGFQFH